MLTAFVLALVALLVAEIYAAVEVAHAIGVVNTIGLLILCSLVGVWLTKHAGLSVLTRIRGQLEQQKLPGNELIDGGLVLAAGAFLLVPGFVSAAIGLVLLLPPTRAFVRAIVRRRMQRYVRIIPGAPRARDDVIDV